MARTAGDSVGPYRLGPTLGTGGFGIVRLGTHVRTGERVAVKVLELERVVRCGLSPQVRREVAALAVLRHPRLVAGRGFHVGGDHLYLLMELVGGGDLYERLVKERRLDEPTAQRLGWQICEGLIYCHARGVYHRDLKLENVLLTTDGDIKIADWGLSFIRALATNPPPAGPSPERTDGGGTPSRRHRGSNSGGGTGADSALSSSLSSSNAEAAAAWATPPPGERQQRAAAAAAAARGVAGGGGGQLGGGGLGGGSPPHALLTTLVGTDDFAPPELLRRVPYRGDKMDAWGVGILLFLMLAGYAPFRGAGPGELATAILGGRVVFPEWFSRGAKEVISGLLGGGVEERWAVADAAAHWWFDGVRDSGKVAPGSASLPTDSATTAAAAAAVDRGNGRVAIAAHPVSRLAAAAAPPREGGDADGAVVAAAAAVIGTAGRASGELVAPSLPSSPAPPPPRIIPVRRLALTTGGSAIYPAADAYGSGVVRGVPLPPSPDDDVVGSDSGRRRGPPAVDDGGSRGGKVRNRGGSGRGDGRSSSASSASASPVAVRRSVGTPSAYALALSAVVEEAAGVKAAAATHSGDRREEAGGGVTDDEEWERGGGEERMARVGAGDAGDIGGRPFV
ncbi:hypothetical protein MMPV_004689 [Pyropia vietnamensis]